MIENITSRNIIKFIKDYFNFVIFIPAILGGLWQIIELSSLSLSFIRFFSVTQLVADGILILLIFLFLIGSALLIPLYSFWMVPPKEDLNDLLIQNTQKKSKSYMDSSPILSLIFFYCFVILIIFGFVNYKVYDLESLKIFIIIGFILIYYVRFLYLNERQNSKNHKKKIYFSTILVFLVICIYVFIFCKHIHKLFFLPQNLINIETLKKEIQSENPKESIKILYTNDKYIFIELKNEKTKIEKIKIIPFENLTKK